MTRNDVLAPFSIEKTDDHTHSFLFRNAQITADKVTALLQLFGENRKINSGYRTPEHNAAVGGAPKSKHLSAQAVDLEDNDKRLGEWCVANVGTLRDLGLSMESLSYTDPVTGETKGTHSGFGGKQPWVHLQTVPPKSGHTVFVP